MESVIRDGTLRLLTAESTCDVILSCQGRRLMAHKVILSVASPIFRDLFLENPIYPTVVILPDISSHTMSLILDYVYTGNVIVYSNSSMQTFLSAAKILQIQLDFDLHLKQIIHNTEDKTDKKGVIKDESNCTGEREPNIRQFHSKKTFKKVPALIPINKVRSLDKLKSIRKTNSWVLPSPWRPRVETVFGDPRDDILENTEYLIQSSIQQSKLYENDSNNNFQPPIFSRYHQNRNTFDQHLLERTNSMGNFLKRINETSKTTNDNTTISRLPEDVAVDRDKPDMSENERLPNMKNWMTSHRENIQKNESLDLTKIPVPENSNRTLNNSTSGDDCDNFKEESNVNECIYVGKAHLKRDNCELDRKEKRFKCEECGKCFSQLRNFKYHRSVHEGTKEFSAKCSECGKIFNDKGYLSSHMKIHRDKKEYACPHCPKRFNQRVAYNMHLRIHTGVKPHECPICGKSFSRKMLLKQHQRVHTGERPYSCPECGKTFADRSNMSLHARLHTGVKPYACNICPKSFTKKHHLKTHMNFHTGLKPYNCQKCGLSFSQSSNMRTHYKKCMLKYHVSTGETLAEEEIGENTEK